MDQERRMRIDELFDAALQEPSNTRRDWLASECEDDQDLFNEVWSLVEFDTHANTYFNGVVQERDGMFNAPDSVGQYTLKDEIGSGGMGVVYQAHDTKLDRTVAIKLFHSWPLQSPEFRERVQVEAQTAARLEHPNVCTIHQVGETPEGHLFIAMAYYEGQDVEQTLASGQSFTPAQAVSIAVAAASGLAYAHGHGIIHRDIKPANLFLTHDGQVRILDFGIARMENQTITREGERVGTPAFMSPEQTLGKDVDPSTDVWSLAVVLYQLLVGEHPLGDYRISGVPSDDWRPAWPDQVREQVPSELVALLNECLVPAREQRLSDMGRMQRVLEQCLRRLEGGTISAIDDLVAEAAHRQVTVLNAVLSLDESQWIGQRAELREIEEITTRIMNRFSGYRVHPSMDEWVVWFGYPEVREGDAVRAVRAALAMQEALLNNPELSAARLTISVHSGEMLMVPEGAQMPPLLGDVPGVAARMHAFIDPGKVVISGETHARVSRQFQAHDAGMFEDARSAQAYPMYGVDLESTAASRLLQMQSVAASPMVGRDLELQRLQKSWQQALNGQGSTVLLSAEAGMGKSRLVRELMDSAVEHEETWLSILECSEQHRSTPLYPVAEMFRRELFAESQVLSGAEKLARMEAFLDQYGLDVPQVGPLFAQMFGLDVGDHYPVRPPAPEDDKQLMLESLGSMVLTRASRQPVLVIVEDLHWADATTLELMGQVIPMVADIPVFILGSHRPEFKPQWPEAVGFTPLGLARLDHDESSALIDHLLGDHAIADGARQTIIEQSNGVPLFVEEMVRAVREQGQGQALIPGSLKESLNAQLEALGPSRELFKRAAVLGREFEHVLLRAVVDGELDNVSEHLKRLIEKGYLQPRGLGAQRRYVIRHALVREAALDMIAPDTLVQWHQHVAGVMQIRFPDWAQSQPERIANHLIAANEPLQATDYLLAAGQQAALRSANVEARTHLDEALTQLGQLPEQGVRLEREVDVLQFLGPVTMALEGYASPRVSEIFERFNTLSSILQDPQRIATALFGFWTHRVVRGLLPQALATGQAFADLARQSQVSDLLLEANVMLGVTYTHMGQLDEARPYLLKALEIHDPEQHGTHAWQFGQDPKMAAHIYLAIGLAMQGQIEEAESHRAQGVTWAELIGHSHSLGFAYFLGARALVHAGEYEQAYELLQRGEQYSMQHKVPTWYYTAQGVRAWCELKLQNKTSSADDMVAGIGMYEAIGAVLSLSYLASLSDQTLIKVGQAGQEALERLDAHIQRAHDLGDLLELTDQLRGKAEAMQVLNADVAAIAEVYAQAHQAAEDKPTLGLHVSVSEADWLQSRALPEAAVAVLEKGLATYPVSTADRFRKQVEQRLADHKHGLSA